MKPRTAALIGFAIATLLVITAGKKMTAALQKIMNTKGAQYREIIAALEKAHGLPAGLLAAVAYRESRFNPKIINGQIKSPVGALGITQWMPSSAVWVGKNIMKKVFDPLNAEQALEASAYYLAWLNKQSGSWEKAIASYNWGLGNVQKKWPRLPAETRGYIEEIAMHTGIKKTI